MGRYTEITSTHAKEHEELKEYLTGTLEKIHAEMEKEVINLQNAEISGLRDYIKVLESKVEALELYRIQFTKLWQQLKN